MTIRRAMADDSVYRDFDRQTRIKRQVKGVMADLNQPYDWSTGLYELFAKLGEAGLEPSGYDILYAVRQIDRGAEAAIVEMLTDLYLGTTSEPAGPATKDYEDDVEETDEDIEFQ